MSLLSTLTGFVGAASLSFFILAIAYITSFCFITPTLNLDKLKDANRESFPNRALFKYSFSAIIFLASIFHAFICFTYPSPPSILCPNSANLSPKLFTWNFHTTLCIILSLVSAQTMLLCFDSNFEFSKPNKLITTGVYGWLQHPSHTARFMIFLINGFLLQRRDGVAACWLEESVVHGHKSGMFFQIAYFLVIAVGCWSLVKRIRDEEFSLKRTFGTDWEDYHKRTKRFVPGVF